jgi:NADPH:quinone reductase-like Zn-dependent oxidoreductase
MRAVTFGRPGGPEVLVWGEADLAQPGPHEVVVDVHAAGVNNADLLQRRGSYAVPPGASPILGLEISGVVSSLGSAVTAWSVGDRVCGLLSGGGYAERVVVAADLLLPVPDGVGLISAAALPEAACTVYSNLAMTATLRPGQTLLVHGGGSGIGTFAIQWAKAIGARVVTTAGSDRKLVPTPR